MTSTPTLPEHLETLVGPIEGGWTNDADGHAMPFQIVRLRWRSMPSHYVFATLGLSAIPLRSRVQEGKTIRQELLIAVPAAFGKRTVPALLHQVGSELLSGGEAILRGDVVGPRGPLFEAAPRLEALYASAPVIFPDAFATFRGASGDTVMVWLVPITHDEAHFVQTRGWSAFEDELVRNQPDLTDVGRESIFHISDRGLLS
jgi:hypothetical protein